jgi:hypothetical protein
MLPDDMEKKSFGVEENIRCSVPSFGGAKSASQWRDSLWDKFYTGVPFPIEFLSEVSLNP